MRFHFLANKILTVLVIVLDIVLQIANAFIGEIVSFNSNGDGLSFSLRMLLSNKWFWIYTVILISYTLLSYFYTKIVKNSDEKIVDIYTDSIGHLLNSATRAYDEGNFEKGDSIVDRINMFKNEMIVLKHTKTSQKRRAKR